MGVNPSAPLNPLRRASASRDNTGRRRSRTSNRGATNNQPRTLTLENHHLQYRHNPNGPLIFYIDRPPLEPPASEVQQTEKVMNYANLLKPSLALSPTADASKYQLSFTVDSLVDAECIVYFGVQERWDESQGLHFLPQHPNRCSVSRSTVPAESGHHHVCPRPLDVEELRLCLAYNDANPFCLPIVIVLQYQVPRVGSTMEDTSARRWQFTYCEALASAEPTGYQLRVIRQRLQLADWTTFDLEDIYGVMGHACHSNDPQQSSVKALFGDVDVDGEGCVICMVNDRDTTVMPCRHMCLCSDCADALRRQTNKCPICRAPIECLMTLKKDSPAT
eukprot:GGOE01014417.1.p1 GENE.GGOE01014417.1~~GGOE01014417.1.p1  ORF type:complete len:334 (+),score=59.07 GGOE01014417.1:90-1091(+)